MDIVVDSFYLVYGHLVILFNVILSSKITVKLYSFTKINKFIFRAIGGFN